MCQMCQAVSSDVSMSQIIQVLRHLLLVPGFTPPGSSIPRWAPQVHRIWPGQTASNYGIGMNCRVCHGNTSNYVNQPHVYMNPITTGMHIQILCVSKCVRGKQTDTLHSKMIRPKRTIVFCSCIMASSRNFHQLFVGPLVLFPVWFAIFTNFGKTWEHTQKELWFTTIVIKVDFYGFPSVFHRTSGFATIPHNSDHFKVPQSPVARPQALSCSISASRLMARKATPYRRRCSRLKVRNEVSMGRCLKWG